MKVFRFFLTRVFLRKPIFAIGALVLFLMANYMAFLTAHSVLSTREGYQQMAHFDKEGTFVANLDPNSDFGNKDISKASIQKVYDRLDSRYHYALYTDGMMTNLANGRGVKVPVSYMNQRYNDLDGFPIAQGSGLTFDYSLVRNDAIPVLVGEGLADDYPLGTQFKMYDPALLREVRVKVVGVIAENSVRSNFYALNSKKYYNFSVVVPVTTAFIKQADVSFNINALNDLVLSDTDRADVSELGDYIDKTIGAKFNLYSYQDNIDYYNEYLFSSLRFLTVASGVLLILIVLLSVWSALISVRVMMRDFTINLMVGLSYGRLRRLFYAYYAGLSLIALLAVFAMAAYSRHSYWRRKDAFLMTYGLWGMIRMDWLALLVASLFDFLLVAMLAQLITWRLRRVPISLGVLQ